MASSAGVTGCSDRDVWRQAHAQISEHESEALEVQLNIREQQNVLDHEVQRLQKTVADTATAKERRRAADASCVRMRAALYTTTKQMEVAKADSIRLLHQRSSLANEVKDAKQALQQAVDRYRKHLEEQQHYLNQVKLFTSSPDTHMQTNTG